MMAAAAAAGFMIHGRRARNVVSYDETESLKPAVLAAVPSAPAAPDALRRREMPLPFYSADAPQSGGPPAPQSSGTDTPQTLSGSAPASPVPAPSGFVGELFHVLGKYKNRPAAQRFVGEITANPAFMKLLKSAPDMRSPVAMMMQFQASGAAAVLIRHMQEPEFKQLVRDISGDPEFKMFVEKNMPPGFKVPKID